VRRQHAAASARALRRAQLTELALWALLGCLVLAATGRAAEKAPFVARRIIGLSPHAAELVVAAGAGDKLIGTVSHSDYPAAVRELPRIGDATRLDREAILMLAPDLAVAWTSGNRRSDLDWLASRGIRIYFTDPRTIDGIAADLIAIGELAGTARRAREAAGALRARLAALDSQRPDGQPIRAFYLLWDSPLMTLGGGSLVSRVMGLCGLENVFSDQPAKALSVSRETLLAARPQVIVRPRNLPPSGNSIQRLWPGEPPSVIEVDPDLLHRPGPRLIEGAEQLCEAVDQLRRNSTAEKQQKRGVSDPQSAGGAGSTPPQQ
jgi:ABC-type hemin transport system substrate-binding protein